MESFYLLKSDIVIKEKELIGGRGVIGQGWGKGGVENVGETSLLFISSQFWRGWGEGRWGGAHPGRGRWSSGLFTNLWAKRYRYLFLLKYMRLADLLNLNVDFSSWGYEIMGTKGTAQWFLFRPLGGWEIIVANSGSWDIGRRGFWNYAFTLEPLLLISGSRQQLFKWTFLYYRWEPMFISFLDSRVGSSLNLYNCWYLGILFLVIYFWYLSVKIVSEMGGWEKSTWVYFIDLYIYSWLLMGENKVESSEEILCLLILWPWCIFVIFSHLFNYGVGGGGFGFAEWGIPVIYGFILLIEHGWELGVYTAVYLMGARGRRSLIVGVLEDLVAVTIMFARVGLQVVRGVIVGMFHFVCREALLTLGRWWTVDVYFSSSLGAGVGNGGFSIDWILLWTDFWIAAGSLVVITAIMFLQLVLLVVSVWLFCKCWYISAMPAVFSIQVKGKFGHINRILR